MKNKKRLVYAEEVECLINGLDSLPWEEDVQTLVNSLTTADAVEVVHGEWLPMYNVDWIYGKEWLTDYICTQCGGLNKKKSPYCPHCGAKMDGGKE